MIPFLATFALLLLCTVNPAVANGYYDKVLAHSRIRGRDQGPNVCALQQILGTKKKYFSSCKSWYQGAICGKKTTVTYECCPGYMRMEGMKGCPAVMPIDHVYGTLGIVGATTTQHYSDVSRLREEIEGKGSYTYFAPSNEAWDNLDSDIRRGLENNVNVELLNALHSHMVNKRLLTKDLKHGMVIPSMYNNLGLFINHYPNGVVTVNCARVIHGNQIATNGVVHVIDRVLTQIGTSIQDFLEAEDELSSFRTAAITSDLLESLGRDGHFTLFAPTNEAFEKLPRGVLERIMGDKVASEALMKYHILNTLQCSEAIMGGGVFETMEGNTIEIGCEGDSITINGIKMVNKKDIVTKNGVIHLIDEVLIPDSAKQVMELAGKQQTTFTDLMAQLGLASSLKPEGEYTLLAPVNNAFSDDTLSMDQRLLKLILQNHILKVKVGLSDLYNGQVLETIGGKQLRVFVYRTYVRGSTFKEIPMTVYRPAMTKIQIEGEPEFKLIKEGETITDVIRGEPIIKKYTKIIDGVPVEITEKQTREERIITGPEIKYTRISAGVGETEETLKKLLQEEVTKVTKFIEGDGHLFEDEEIKRLLQGDTPARKIQANKRVQGARRRSREGRTQ
ncbi:PREDICTED: periostin [Dipodomys ordii]|uniref:Periostin n=1 Tax=Dipodomys ordii TaxID=10020 RepID=A0A1S3GFY1_DIPOR|nr:PREDICTED: periostin [Dipodomys ordii]